ncbi:hypothetical protein OAO87_01425 [bacterium]|nr:hypothetical protein [bacterium]
MARAPALGANPLPRARARARARARSTLEGALRRRLAAASLAAARPVSSISSTRRSSVSPLHELELVFALPPADRDRSDLIREKLWKHAAPCAWHHRSRARPPHSMPTNGAGRRARDPA